MASNIPLDDLIEALAGAVIDAQVSIERRQLLNLRRYFDEDWRPKTLQVRVPSMRPDAEPGEDDLYRAPLLPLMPPNPLRIKDVEITFDADLGQLHESDAPAGAGKGKSISVDTAATGKVGSVHVVLRVEGVEPTEGESRLLNHLAQTQGVVGKPK
jgi:hypothetical protein